MKFLIPSLALLAACATTTAEQRNRANVVRISKQEPAGNCRYVAAVRGSHLALLTTPKYEIALEEFRVKAFEQNANYAVIDGVETLSNDRINVHGRAFACPDTTTAAPVSSCVPDCSPGFVCAEAKCISACNPACKESERCGSDRLCHPAN